MVSLSMSQQCHMTLLQIIVVVVVVVDDDVFSQHFCCRSSENI